MPPISDPTIGHSGGVEVAQQSARRPTRRKGTKAERATAVALLTDYITELKQARSDGDDDLRDDIANDGVEIVLGGTSWDLSLDGDGWMAAQSGHTSEYGGPAFGEDDLIGTVGPSSLSPEEIVRRIDTLEFDEFSDN